MATKLSAEMAFSPVRLVLEDTGTITLPLLLHCTGVFLCVWGVSTS